MRPVVPWILVTLIAGCAGTSPYSASRPPVHPLLDPSHIAPSGSSAPVKPEPIARNRPRGPTARPPTVKVRRRPTPTRKPRATRRKARKAKRPVVGIFPPPTGPRSQVLGRVSRLIRQRTIGSLPASDIGLVNAAYLDFKMSAASVQSLWDRGEPVGRYPIPADIVFFNGAGGSPQLGIIYAIHRDWVMDVVAVTRGKVRKIRLYPGKPHLRSAQRRIYNTFLRRKRKTDRRGSAYLAGQLVVGYRTYFPN
jgi:hypothetical protein